MVILSHGFWMRTFGGDPGVIGRQVAMAGADTRTVVGVMPPDFKPPFGAPLGLGSPVPSIPGHPLSGAPLLDRKERIALSDACGPERLPALANEY